MKKLIFSLGVIFMLTSGCTKLSNNQANDLLNIHFPVVSLNLDPHKMEDAYSMTVVLQLHRGLLRYTPSGDVLPDLASEWKESADHKTYNLILKDTTFSDGSKLEALNVQMTFARLFASGAAMGADIDYIAGAAEFRKSGDLSKLGIKIKSPKEIEFQLTHPSALFLKHLAVADCAILPLKNFKDEIVFSEKSAFSGPYKVKSISIETGLLVEKWRPDPLDSKSPPRMVHFVMSNKMPSELAKAGETDSLDHDPIFDDLKKDLISQGWTETATELIAETYLILSPKKVSAEVRKVLFSAVDQVAVAKLLGSKYIPAFGAIPRGLPGELSEADMNGLKEKSKPVKAEINLEYDPESKTHQKLYPYLKQVWEKAGIKVTLKPLSKKDLLDKLFSSQCEVCIGQKGLDYPDGFSVLTYFKSGYPSNYFHVNDPAIDKLINEAGKILDRTERENTYREIQRKVLSQHTLVPLAFGSEASGLFSSKIKTVPPHVMGLHMLPFETIEMKRGRE